MSDADADPLTYRVVDAPQHGTLSGTPPRLIYTPEEGYAGPDSFTFDADDGKARSNIAEVVVTVLGDSATDPGGLWISREEVALLPMSGSAWDRMKAAADGSLGTPKIADFNTTHDVRTLAVALVYARTSDALYRVKAADAIMSAIGTEVGGEAVMLGRNLVCYVIAADLIGLADYDAAKDNRFRTWLESVRYTRFYDGSLISNHEQRANNHGTMAGGARIAVAVYLEDTAELARSADVFAGWLGDRAAWAGFRYPYDLSWQADVGVPVAINPLGAVKDGYSIDGAMPEEMRRGCSFRVPPCYTGYPWEGLQGALVQAMILSRRGYDVWNWSDQALLRAVQFLLSLEFQYGGWWATGDDTWIPWLVNRAYGTSFPTGPANIGKNMGWTDWMYGP